MIILGLYNFNKTSEAKIKISLNEIYDAGDSFPIWGILVIIASLVFAILIIIYLAI